MATTSSSAMTLRQLFEAVINGNITEKEIEKARSEIAKLDAANAKRAEKSAEKAKQNEPLKQAIFEFLRENGEKTTVEIAKGVEELEGSSPKASAMCRQMVEEGRLVSFEVSVKSKGKQKAYNVAPTEC